MALQTALTRGLPSIRGAPQGIVKLDETLPGPGMTEVLLSAADADSAAATPVHLRRPAALERFLPRRSGAVQRLAKAQDFKAKPGQALTVSRADGRIERVLFGLGDADPVDAMALRSLPSKLSAGDYRIASAPPRFRATEAAAAFALGTYVFDRYRKSPDKPKARLVAPAQADLAEARRIAHACAMARDMVNTPANDMGPL